MIFFHFLLIKFFFQMKILYTCFHYKYHISFLGAQKMSDFDYKKLIEQVISQKNQKERDELFKFIGEKGDDRFITPLMDLLKVEDNPQMRQSLYATFSKIGTKLASEVIKNQLKSKLPMDNGSKIPQKNWDDAIAFLVLNLEQQFVRKIEELIKKDGYTWGQKNKGNIGIYIRNLLRNNGFNWGEEALEAYWQWIVEDAISKIQKAKK